MAVSPGTRLGVYEILSPLGAGGMGEVFRARDTKLGRDVALKILPESFVNDAERLARFRREAQVLASLNHPHIGAIYGLDEANGQQFLVLELVDGESLDRRIARGAIPVDEALGIAKQIAEALEAAHDKGVIHRDLKPGNIALTRDGEVKVLDFGLAKAMESASGHSIDVANSPTITSPALMTGLGVILGTAAYMSPEQAKGRPADKRSDVWAFGCVLYEMLTGKRAFQGEDVSDTIAAVLRSDPQWSALPPSVPFAICEVLRHSLEKDRKARITDVAVVSFLLKCPPGWSVAAPSTSREEQRRPVFWRAVAGLFAVTTLVGFSAAYLRRPVTPSATRFFIAAPDKGDFVTGGRTATTAVISPDGRALAFTVRDQTGKTLLWVRSLDSLTAQPLFGTDDAAFPFWSSDSRSLAFFAGGKLIKMAVGGGPPQTICAVTNSRGGTWSREGIIVLGGGPGPLFRVSSGGGEPEALTKLAPGQVAHQFPSFLPDGRHVVFQAGATRQEAGGLYTATLDTGETKRLTTADSGAVYDSRSHHLLFVRQGTLLAQSFNPTTLTLNDDPSPIAERVEWGVFPGVVAFSVSDTGVLTYGSGIAPASLQMVWLDRQGRTIGTLGPPSNYRGLDLAPDGQRVAARRYDGHGSDIWLSDVAGGTTSRFTFDASQENSSPIWSPDGAHVAFGSVRGGKWGLYRKPSNGSGGEERLIESDIQILPVSWSPDGRFILFTATDTKTGNDLLMLPLEGERKPVSLLQTPFNESHGQVSPDGKWLAYRSDETGQAEIYVRPFPAGVGKWQLSTGGGNFPRWRPDGRELFYMTRNNNGKLVTVEVRSGGPTFQMGARKELFDSGYVNLAGGGTYHPYVVSADGQHFLIPRLIGNQEVVSPLVVVLEWARALN